MRNITAKELLELAKYHRENGEELIAIAYEEEEKNLQEELNFRKWMNRD